MNKNQKSVVGMIIILIVIAILVGPLKNYTVPLSENNEPEEPPVPWTTLRELGGEVNFEATVENGPANEVDIAVNPTDPENIIAGAKDYTLGPQGSGYKVWSGYYWSRDGGETWGNGLMGYPNINDCVLGVYDDISDPVVGFDGRGNAYYCGLVYKSTSEVVPDFPRPWIANNGIYMARSTDGGETYSQISLVVSSPTGAVFHDKQWFVIDPDNGNIYVTWTLYSGVQGKIVFSRSTDGGLTWTLPRDISRTFDVPRQTQGAIPDVGPDGSVNVIWVDFASNSLMFSKSTDGGATWPVFAEPIVDIVPTPSGLDENEYRTPTIPSMRIDRSDADTRGNIYITWSDYRNGNADAMITVGTNGGTTWSQPMRVNDDPSNSTADQYFPTVDVSPLGDVHVIFYDKRDDPDHYMLELYYAHSKDGRNFNPNWKITTERSDPQYSYHQNGDVFMGDYLGVASSENRAYLIWTDTRKGEADAFVAEVIGNVELEGSK